MTGKPKRAALYVRVSTDEQTVDNQRLAQEVVCEQRGWQVVQVYADNGISGANGREQRPGLDALRARLWPRRHRRQARARQLKRRFPRAPSRRSV
jgi:DNA invertase Pin-like site-specific DNA recombinase